MRPVAAPRRWIWGLSGLVTIAALAIPGVRLITHAGVPPATQTTVTRTVTVPQPVTSVDAQSYRGPGQSYGGPVQITTGPVRRVRVTETITYSRGGAGPPSVTQSVSGGRLTLADPVCQVSRCSVGFTVIVPAGVTAAVASQGGVVIVSGIAGADLDSGGGPVSATEIRGHLTAATEGGLLSVDGLTGPLHANTARGPLHADNVCAAAATAITGGGEARIVFAAAPDTLLVSTGGGAARLAVPGGPYALTANSDGGPQLVSIATDPAAGRSIAVTSGDGPIELTGSGSPPLVSWPPLSRGWAGPGTACDASLPNASSVAEPGAAR